MSDVEFLIKHEREGTNLDFKREQYRKEKYQDLLKDILSIANAPIDGKKYIIIGVKDKPDGTKEFFSIPKNEIVDQATYQQIVRENIEPYIDFSYYSIDIDNYTFGVIEVNDCIDPPYMMKKDYKTLNKGDCFIRRGSQQERLTRRDLDEVLRFKSRKVFDNKISIGFNKGLDQKLVVKAVKEFSFPSDKAKKEIEKILEDRAKQYQFGKDINEQFKIKIRLPFEFVPYEERSTEELEQNLKNIAETYYDDDLYYMGEIMSEKMDICLKNDGDEYLEDVSIVLSISSPLVTVIDKIYDEPKSDYDYLNSVQFTNTPNLYYPIVENEAGTYIIRQHIGDLKHHQLTEAFSESLRVLFMPDSINKNIEWSYSIFAKNLPIPIKGKLSVEVV